MRTLHERPDSGVIPNFHDGIPHIEPASRPFEAHREQVPSRAAGLFRTAFAGPGRTLADAFENLERAAPVDRIVQHPTRNIVGARIALLPEEGEGYWSITRVSNDLIIVIQDFAYKDPRVELMGGDGMIQFNFRISGDLSLAVSRREALRLTRPSLFLWTQPAGIEVSEWTAPRAHERAISVSVRPQFLIDNLIGSTCEVPLQLQGFVNADCQPNFLQLPLSADVFELVIKLLRNRHEGVRSLVYLEATALELLCEAVRGLEGLTDVPDEQYSDRELRCLHAARDFLMTHFSPPPTIRQVARSAGLNATTLQRGFRAVFGETIFDFGVRCRMQHALALLRDQKLPVARVAEMVGYQHQTSFATAFRRHFGARPKDVRHSRRSAST